MKSKTQLKVISAKRVIDIIAKINRLKDGKIKYYQVKYLNEIQEITDYCLENKILSFIYRRIDINKLYEVPRDISLDSTFYSEIWKALEINEENVYICVMKGFSKKEFDKYDFDNWFILRKDFPTITF